MRDQKNIYIIIVIQEDKKWVEVYRQSINDYEDFDIVSTYPDDNKSKVYVIANNGEDKTGLWLYDFENKSIYQRYILIMLKTLMDLYIITIKQNILMNLLVVTTFKDRFKRIFINNDLTLEVEAAYYQLEK